ncbi:FUSC family protein [Peptoclostridium litorale]|nr:aromatic acid exporter family protein [Peptoclostridium litorale]
MRNIKTATAVFLCVATSNALGMEYPFYAAIAAVISMKTSMANSFKVGKNRMMGTAVGALTGLLFALIQPGNAILCGIGMVVLIYICNVLKWNDSVTIAGIVFMAIMVNMDGKNPFEYSISRLIDTFMGISIALTVNYMLFPYNYYGSIIKRHGELSKKMISMASDTTRFGGHMDLDGLRKEISKLESQVDAFSKERRPQKHEIEKIDSVRADLSIFKEACTHLAAIACIPGKLNISESNAKRLEGICGFKGAHLENKGSANDEAGIVFNYHLGRVLDCVEELVFS